MKIATGNRINEFWEELKEVLVPRSKVLKTIEEIEANTNEENIAGATALKAVNNKLILQLPDDIQISAEGSGADVKYYAQLGADTASKKQLGRTKFELRQFTSTFSYKVSHDGMLCIDWSFRREHFETNTASATIYYNNIVLSTKTASGAATITHTYHNAIEVKSGDVIRMGINGTTNYMTNNIALCLLY